VERQSATVRLTFEDPPYIHVGTLKVFVRQIVFTGVIEVRTVEMPSVYKALFKLGETIPVAGCCISDFGERGLIGLVISGRTTIELVRISISDRNKKKIYRQKLSASLVAGL
jgi:hypothetical protein